VPVLLFSLVGVVGLAAIFRVMGDESDYVGDDLEDEEETSDILAPEADATARPPDEESARKDPENL